MSTARKIRSTALVAVLMLLLLTGVLPAQSSDPAQEPNEKKQKKAAEKKKRQQEKQERKEQGKQKKPAGGANVNLAEARYSLGDFAGADTLAESILAVRPDDFRALMLRAEVALLSNRFAETEALLAAAIEARPTHREAKRLLAEAYYRQDRFTEAAVLLAAAGATVRAENLATFDGLTPYAHNGEATLELTRIDPYPVVMVGVNGGPAVPFAVDSGVSEIHLDADWARELGIERVGFTRELFGSDSKTEIGHARADSIQLGALTVQNVPVRLIDGATFTATAPGEDIRGLLGAALFSHFLTTLDYRAGELHFERRVAAETDPASDDGSIRTPFFQGGNHLLVTHGRLNDSEQRLFMIDTALAGTALSAPLVLIEEAEIELMVSPTDSSSPSADTPMPFLFESLSLGEASGANLPGLFGTFPRPLEHSAGFRIAGIVGHGFLRPWTLSFDFDAMQIVFRDAADQDPDS